MTSVLLPRLEVRRREPTVHKSCCPVHRRQHVRRAVVHAKGCPGASGVCCMDTCHPKQWHYCLRCDWRTPYALANNIDPESPDLAESARAGLQCRRLRQKAGIAQRRLALGLGMSESYISLFEAGSIIANERVIRRAFEYLSDSVPPQLVVERPPRSPRALPHLLRVQETVPIRLGMLCRRARLELMMVDIIDAAAEMGVDAVKLARFESGEGGFDEAEIRRVLEYLGVEAPALDDAMDSVAWVAP